MQNHILIATDSRGRGLKDFLAKTTLFPQSHVHLGIFPGGNFSTVSNKVWNEVLSLQSLNDKIEIHAYVAAGICSLTKKIRHPNKSYEIFYHRNTENLDQLKQDITDFYRDSVYHNIYGKVVHIPPVSLAKCNANCNSPSSISSPALATQQLHLEEDIKSLNNQISTINKQFQKTSVRWDKDLQTTKQKLRGRNKKIKVLKSTPCYNDLYDGVHPNVQLSEKWFRFLCTSIESDLKEFNQKTLPVSIESESSEEDSDCETPDSWDYKRLSK